MTYLAGYSLLCAQGSGKNVYSSSESPEPAERIGFNFLNRPHQAAYFRAFPNERQNKKQLFDFLAMHLEQAAADAGWGTECLSEIPIFIGSTSYLISDYELDLLDCSTAHHPYHSLNQFADELKQRWNNRQVYCFATACTSSAHAIMQAYRILAGGLSDRALVAGIESFNLLTLMHFHSLNLLSDQYIPFGGNGFVLGEAVACVALSRKAPVSKPALHLRAAAAATSSASPVETDVAGLSCVMRQALKQAGAEPHEILAVKAHAVGTADTDKAEAEALKQVFGRPIPLAAFKPFTGHTLGACGVLETILFHQALSQGSIRNASAAAENRRHPLQTGLYLANFFGFGGSNLSFVWDWQP